MMYICISTNNVCKQFYIRQFKQQSSRETIPSSSLLAYHHDLTDDADFPDPVTSWGNLQKPEIIKNGKVMIVYIFMSISVFID